MLITILGEETLAVIKVTVVCNGLERGYVCQKYSFPTFKILLPV